jgi:hypothetical protein
MRFSEIHLFLRAAIFLGAADAHREPIQRLGAAAQTGFAGSGSKPFQCLFVRPHLLRRLVWRVTEAPALRQP